MTDARAKANSRRRSQLHGSPALWSHAQSIALGLLPTCGFPRPYQWRNQAADRFTTKVSETPSRDQH